MHIAYTNTNICLTYRKTNDPPTKRKVYRIPVLFSVFRSMHAESETGKIVGCNYTIQTSTESLSHSERTLSLRFFYIQLARIITQFAKKKKHTNLLAKLTLTLLVLFHIMHTYSRGIIGALYTYVHKS